MTSTAAEMTRQAPAAPAPSDSRTWSRAWQDLRAGARSWQLWTHLGWQDLRLRYRRSLIGPFWMTVTMSTTTVGLGILFSLLLGNQLATFLPYIGSGLIIWGFISGCLLEGPDSFTASGDMIKQVPAPLTVFVLRTVWRQLITLAHNMIIYVVLLLLFFPALHHRNYTMSGAPCTPGGLACQPGLGWNALLAMPGFLLLLATMTAGAMGLGIVATRFRDIKPLIASFLQLLFFVTPISWPLDNFVRQVGNRAWIIQLNPLFHYVQIIRQPMVGQRVDWWSWLIAGVLTVAAWSLALVMLRRYRARVCYWL
jgi:ABC-2 type transport system permease protein